MKRTIFFTILILVLVLYALHLFSKNKGAKTSPNTYIKITERQLIPDLSIEDTLLVKSGFFVAFNKKNKIPCWAAYTLSKSEAERSIAERSDNFKPETCVITAEDMDYKGSGFDRGHIVPAKDMSYSEKSLDESFYYSNICPQDPNLNRGKWKQLEEKTRCWAIENDSVFIITGAFSKSQTKTIGKNNILVPEYLYKALIDYSEPEMKAVAFLFKNCRTTKPLSYFAITVDSLESFTKIDFFSCIDDSVENRIEATFNPARWNLK